MMTSVDFLPDDAKMVQKKNSLNSKATPCKLENPFQFSFISRIMPGHVVNYSLSKIVYQDYIEF